MIYDGGASLEACLKVEASGYMMGKDIRIFGYRTIW